MERLFAHKINFLYIYIKREREENWNDLSYFINRRNGKVREYVGAIEPQSQIVKAKLNIINYVQILYFFIIKVNNKT